MRGLGIVALISAVLSFLFWMASWLYWNLLMSSVGVSSPMRYAAMAFTVASAFCELLALGLLSIGLISAAKRLPKA